MAHDEVSCLVSGSLSTVLRLSRFHGVAGIYLKPLGNVYVARISTSGVLYSWLVFTVLSVANFIGVIMDLQFYGTHQAVRVHNLAGTIVWFSEIAMIRTIIFFALYNGRTRIENVLRYLKQIEKVNKALRGDLTYQQPKEKILKAGVIGLLVTSYSAHFASFGLSIFNSSINKETTIFLLYRLHLFEDIMALLLLMQVACFVIQVQSAFKQLNNRLRELLEIQELNSLSRRSLRDISNSFVQLCCVVRDFNVENGFMMFVMFTATVTSLFITSCQLSYILCLPEGVVNRLFIIILVVIWFLSHFTKLLVLIEPCHRTHEEMEETHVLLNKVTYHLTPIGCPVLFELDIFHKQVILSKTTFSPLEVFTLDRSLISTVIAALVTFFVFLKQHSNVVDCK